jgi:hypothetical protein
MDSSADRRSSWLDARMAARSAGVRMGCSSVQLAAVQGRFGKEVVLATDGGGQGRDQFLPDGVQGRVGHLGEQLAEIVVEQAGLFGEDRQGDVVAHGSGGFDPFCCHGTQDQFEVFGGVAEALLFAQVFGSRPGGAAAGGRFSRCSRFSFSQRP